MNKIYDYSGNALAEGKTKEEAVRQYNNIFQDAMLSGPEEVMDNGNDPDMTLSPDEYVYWTIWNIRD